MLKAMRRAYDRERYLDRGGDGPRARAGRAMSTDVVVGFPGESKADFEETLEVVEAVRYDSAFAFIFSPRRGTEAADCGSRCRTS